MAWRFRSSTHFPWRRFSAGGPTSAPSSRVGQSGSSRSRPSVRTGDDRFRHLSRLRPYASGTQAVLDWVWGRAAPENHLPHENALVVVVPDYRCRIKSAEWRTGRVTTVVEGPEEDLELQVLVQASGGHSPCPPFTDLLRSEPLEVRVPSETEKVELFLVRSNGELASHVLLHSAGEEFEAKPGRPTVEEQARADLRGEGQYVEFKPFIEPKHQNEHEVVKSIVAFSNTEGGRLYIGVSKDC